ncbi:hypothetical protein HPB48_008705 [Haemaphysalis longicornis]|uniref:M13 family peptidase n=1 Tax=Haemaphysalis longicornis TaxID=44386 RepID=A0A9J6H0P0_HAELO|nr:hypothetical protein HPB48_008705 [Haemaphysalis longicornis]
MTIVVAAFLVALVLSGVLGYAIYLRNKVFIQYCDWPGCLEQVKELRAAMDPSVKPCDNFYKFVCGSWKPLWGERSMIERMYAKSFSIAAAELEKEEGTVVPTVHQFYKSCTRNRSYDEAAAEIEDFKKFKQDLGLMWPEIRRPAGRDFLRILITMAVQWNINILFTVRAWRAFRGRGQTLFMRRGALEPMWRDDGFAELVMVHCELLNASGCTDVVRKLARTVRHIHNAVVNITLDTTTEVAIPVRNISNFIRRGKPWEEYLNEAYENRFSWDPDKTVVLEDALILENIKKLLAKYTGVSDTKLLMGLAWVFIRTHLWVFTGQTHLHPTPELLQRPTPGELACLKLAEGAFGLAVSAKHIHQRYDTVMRGMLKDFFFRIKKSLKTQFYDAPWIPDIINQKYFLKLDAMALDMMPPEDFFSNERLAKLYSGFPTINHTSFVQNYIEVMKAFRQKLTDEAFADVVAKSLEGASLGRVASVYYHYYNTIFMGLGVLEPPLLHAKGTFATKFGSAGTLLAASMARSFGRLGVQFNHRGEAENWWTPPDAYEDRMSCDLRASAAGAAANSTPATTAPLYALLSALETSFDAYRDSLPKKGEKDYDADDFRLLGLEEYSDDQVFFMSYCLMTCAVDGNSDMCNVPMRHSKNFSRVYSCPRDAKMNPKKKCIFF